MLQDTCEGFSDLYEYCNHADELSAELFTHNTRTVKNDTSAVPLAVEVIDGNGAIVFRSPVE